MCVELRRRLFRISEHVGLLNPHSDYHMISRATLTLWEEDGLHYVVVSRRGEGEAFDPLSRRVAVGVKGVDAALIRETSLWIGFSACQDEFIGALLCYTQPYMGG